MADGETKRPPGRAKRSFARPARPEPDLRGDLRDFAAARPEGWNHEDWLTFLRHLAERGHDTGDADEIGRLLERERLAVVLSAVQGLGPRRVETLVSRYGTLWKLRQAGVDELAALGGMNRPVAERVRQALT